MWIVTRVFSLLSEDWSQLRKLFLLPLILFSLLLHNYQVYWLLFNLNKLIDDWLWYWHWLDFDYFFYIFIQALFLLFFWRWCFFVFGLLFYHLFGVSHRWWFRRFSWLFCQEWFGSRTIGFMRFSRLGSLLFFLDLNMALRWESFVLRRLFGCDWTRFF